MHPSRWNVHYVVLAALMAIGGFSPAGAQVVNGRLVGIVRDQSGALISNAEVAATDISTGIKWTAHTTAAGEYVFPSLAAGDYRLEASQNGFRTTRIEHVRLEVLQTASVDINLTVGTVSENVTVEAATTLLQTQTSDIGSVISEKQINSMPLNGRDVLQLATLAPGVNTFYSTQSAPARGAQNFQGPNFLGGAQNVGTDITVGVQREISTRYELDGINITSPLVGQITLLPSPDDVQEFKAELSNAPSSFDSPQSINVISKSGTNAWHGAAYDYLRNDKFDARNFFQISGRKPALRFNQFGAQLGGPIVSNKAFFFLSYDGTRSHIPATTFASVPTAAELSGDFNYPGAPTIYDFNSANPSSSQPFPGNVIPPSRISSFATAYNQFLPKPNFTGTGSLAPFNFTTALNNPFQNDQASGRFDYTFSPRDHVFARYTYTTTTNSSPGIMPLYGLSYPYSGHNIATEETHAFSNTLLNIFRFGFTKSSILVSQEGSNGTNYDSLLGISNIAGGTNPLQFGLPTVNITDLGQFGPSNYSTPRGGDWKLFQWTDQLTYIHGSHTFQFGGDFQHNMYATTNPTASRGYFQFQPFYTGIYGVQGGIGLADYLLGDVLFALGDSGDSYQDLRWTTYDGYIQDDWRILPNLTLNLGVRYDYATAPADRLNRQSYFDFSLPGIVTASSGAIHNGIIFSPKTNFAPRVGLAWRPSGNKTVVHAGYGLYYSINPQAEDLFLHNNPPFYDFQFITNFPTPAPITSFFPAAAGASPSSFFLFTVDPHEKTPSYQQWNLSVERELRRDLKLQIGYVGGQGSHQPRRINANQAVLGTMPIQTRRPYPQFGDLLESFNGTSSNYNSLQVSVVKKFSTGFSTEGSYVHANGFDYATDPGEAAQNRLDLQAEYGPSAFLVRNRFVFDGTWELPIGKGERFWGSLSGPWNHILSGWGISDITLLQSGTPLTITVNNMTNTGQFLETRANTTCDGNLAKSSRTLTGFFNTSCFSQPPANTFGNSRRGAITGPGLNNNDISIMKRFLITEDKTLRFDAQFFNVFNHPQFNAPVTTVGAPGFGGISSALSGRNVQLSLKFQF
jgi:hypothetical protein